MKTPATSRKQKMTNSSRKSCRKTRARLNFTPLKTPGKSAHTMVRTPCAFDRFIPTRDNNQDGAMLSMASSQTTSTPGTGSENHRSDQPINENSTSQSFNTELARSLFQGQDFNSKILTFKKKGVPFT